MINMFSFFKKSNAQLLQKAIEAEEKARKKEQLFKGSPDYWAAAAAHNKAKRKTDAARLRIKTEETTNE